MNIVEAKIKLENHVLLLLSRPDDESVFKGFAGSIVKYLTNLSVTGKTVYLYGDLSKISAQQLEGASRVVVIQLEDELETQQSHDWPTITLGQLPISVHGLGILYRQFFPNDNFFQKICDEHAFQSLTESTKPGVAHRTGIYLTPVERQGEDLNFRLLRCSTNLSGPTENFGPTDSQIVDQLNEEASYVFEDYAPMNHVLAQVYHNRPAADGKKEAKAKIKSHADKTKDMPGNGMMAFCTFYDQLGSLEPLTKDPFDFGHKQRSALTQLHFRIKHERQDGTLPKSFSLTLYPGSVFMMPLSTNRLYTHETRPPVLNADRIPTRLGYVVRCSETEAVYRDGQTYLKQDGFEVMLEEPTPEGMAELRRLYAEENKSEAFIDYGNQFKFSMNTGDYRAPKL